MAELPENQELNDYFEETKRLISSERKKYWKKVITELIDGGHVNEIVDIAEGLEELAIYDRLTGCFTKTGFLYRMIYEEMPEINRNKTPFSYLFLDMIGLKELNNTRGHDEGDRAILKLCGAVRESIRSGDLFARWTKGDEFVVLLTNCDSTNSLNVVERIKEKLPQKFVSIGASMGSNEANFLEDIARAEKNMYNDKLEQTGNNYEFRQ